MVSFCYEHNLKCLPCFSLDCLSISLCLFFFFFPFFFVSLCYVFFFSCFGVCPSCLICLFFLLLASFLCFFLLEMNLGVCFFSFFVSLCFMKRTTSKYSIRQVSFTNIYFVVVSKGPPHLTLKPSIFQLVSVVFVLFFWGGVLLLLVWFVSLFVSFVLDYE